MSILEEIKLKRIQYYIEKLGDDKNSQFAEVLFIAQDALISAKQTQKLKKEVKSLEEELEGMTRLKDEWYNKYYELNEKANG